MPQKEIFSRRNLPHWYVPGAAHFITYRLFGTLPQTLLEDLKRKKEDLLQQKPKSGFTMAQHRSGIHKKLFGIFDEWLDKNSEVHWLADPRVAAIIRSNLYHHHHGGKYKLLAYCVMSNHVHVLLQPTSEEQAGRGEQVGRLHYESAPLGESTDCGSPLSSIMHSLKSYTAHEANKILKRSGVFWQVESYDHWVRDDDELERIVNYIAANPVKAGLVGKAHEWYFSSAHDRFLRDGEHSGWLRWDD